MAGISVKVEYGQNRFATFLLENATDISFEALIFHIKKNCTLLSHLPSSNIRLRYRDEDGDMVNLTDNKFAFSEMLRTAKDVKDRDFKKIYIQASEVDSPLPKKCKQDVTSKPCQPCKPCEPTPSASSTRQKLLFAPATPTQSQSSSIVSQSPLDKQKLEIENNLQVISAQIASAKLELNKLNEQSKGYLALAQIRERLCSNCHNQGHTKPKCTELPCTSIDHCKIKDKHPEFKAKITTLQRDIKALENRHHEEDAHLKSFVAARERAGSSFFAVMRPRLKAQDVIKYGSGNRVRLDRDLLVLHRALKNVPDWEKTEDWRLPIIIKEYENSKI